jgi:hypothetical protein
MLPPLKPLTVAGRRTLADLRAREQQAAPVVPLQDARRQRLRREKTAERIGALDAAIIDALEAIKPEITRVCAACRNNMTGPVVNARDVTHAVSASLERVRSLMLGWCEDGEHDPDQVLSPENLSCILILAQSAVSVHMQNAHGGPRRPPEWLPRWGGP